jgi:hypothetical protein
LLRVQRALKLSAKDSQLEEARGIVERFAKSRRA